MSEILEEKLKKAENSKEKLEKSKDDLSKNLNEKIKNLKENFATEIQELKNDNLKLSTEKNSVIEKLEKLEKKQQNTMQN